MSAEQMRHCPCCEEPTGRPRRVTQNQLGGMPIGSVVVYECENDMCMHTFELPSSGMLKTLGVLTVALFVGAGYMMVTDKVASENDRLIITGILTGLGILMAGYTGKSFFTVKKVPPVNE